MWENVGILRDAAGSRRRSASWTRSNRRSMRCGLAGTTRAFNLTWHDWMNLESLITVSRAIAAPRPARTDSRGAHFRADFPESGPLESSAFTSIRKTSRSA